MCVQSLAIYVQESLLIWQQESQVCLPCAAASSTADHSPAMLWDYLSLPSLLLLLSTVLLYLLHLQCRKPSGFPPGPGTLPLLGSLLYVPHVPGLLTNAAGWFIKRYGKLVSLSGQIF